MTRLALLRHGRTEWNRDGRIQGRSDIPLDDEARAELQGLALPTPWDAAEIWASPMSRAIETAQIVAGRAPGIAPALVEMDWGQWEGQRGVDLLEETGSGYRHIEEWGWNFRAPDGESPAEIWHRLVPWIASRTSDTVAVCHIGVMRVILARAHEWHFRGPPPFRIKRNRLYVVDLDTFTAEPQPVRLAVADSAS